MDDGRALINRLGPALFASSYDGPAVNGRRATRATLLLFVLLGALLTILNLHWPIARNALVYAKASQDIVARSFNLYAVVRDGVWTGGKPILFSLLASPLTWLWNADIAVIITSALCTVFFLWTALLVLTKLNLRVGLNETALPLELALVMLNPLALYQFWSGYPDSLLAGFILLAFYLTEVVVTEPQRDTRWQVAALGTTILAAIHTKLYGAVLCISCPLYIILHGKRLLAQSTMLKAKIGLLSGAFLAPLALLALAKVGAYPLLSINANTGFDDYVVGLWETGFKDLQAPLVMMGFAILLAFHFSLLFLFEDSIRRALFAPPVVFFLLYMGGLLPASGASYNMRYFLPFFVFLACPLAVGALALPDVPRRIIGGLYGATAIVLTLIFNVAPVEEAFHPLTARLFGAQLEPQGLLDNLRLRTQIKLKDQVDAINTRVPTGGTLFWSSDYYEKATHGLAHDLGVKADLDVRYVLNSDDAPPVSSGAFLTAFTSQVPIGSLWRSPPWATAIGLGDGLFRLDPIAVSLISTSGDYVQQGQPLRLLENISAGSSIHVSAVDILGDGHPLRAGSGESMEMTLSAPTLGRHEFVARARYGEGNIAVSRPTIVYVGISAFERAADKTSDLILEDRDGGIYTTQGVLALDPDERWTGLHFENIAVPQGAHIRHAYLRLTVADPEQRKTVVSIWGQQSSGAAGLQRNNGDLSRRPRTTAKLVWNLAPWRSAGEVVTSAELAPVLDEIFALKDWRPGASVLLLVNVSGQMRQVRTSWLPGSEPPALVVEE